MSTGDRDSGAAGVQLAVAQFSPGADEHANLAQVTELVARAAAEHARLVVLPEYSSAFIDPFDASLAGHAQSLDGPFTRALAALAARHDVTVVAGMLEHAADGRRVHNTVVAVDGTGIRARYRKQHLYDAFGQRESQWVQPGEIQAPQLFEVDGMRVGIQTCYDLRFPESTRVLADAGADLVLVPAQWVRGPLKEHHWRTLIQARAIENTVAVAAADHAPPRGMGLSMIVDAEGVQVAALGTVSGVAVSRIRRADIEQVRAVNPVLQLRRYRVVPAP